MKPKVTRDKLEQLWRDPVNWKRGLIYLVKTILESSYPKSRNGAGGRSISLTAAPLQL